MYSIVVPLSVRALKIISVCGAISRSVPVMMYGTRQRWSVPLTGRLLEIILRGMASQGQEISWMDMGDLTH